MMKIYLARLVSYKEVNSKTLNKKNQLSVDSLKLLADFISMALFFGCYTGTYDYISEVAIVRMTD